MCENIWGAIETDLLKRKGAAQGKLGWKFLIANEILEDKNANCYTHHVIYMSRKMRYRPEGIECWWGKLLVEIWEFGSLPREKFEGWLMGGSLCHSLPYNQSNTKALPHWVPSWISYPETETTTSIWFLATARPNRKLVLMSTEFKLFVEGGSLASTQWVSHH